MKQAPSSSAGSGNHHRREHALNIVSPSVPGTTGSRWEKRPCFEQLWSAATPCVTWGQNEAQCTVRTEDPVSSGGQLWQPGHYYRPRGRGVPGEPKKPSPLSTRGGERSDEGRGRAGPSERLSVKAAMPPQAGPRLWDPVPGLQSYCLCGPKQAPTLASSQLQHLDSDAVARTRREVYAQGLHSRCSMFSVTW